MKIKVRYDNQTQILELDDAATEELWVCLSLGSSTGLTEDEKRQTLQEAVDEYLNKPEYNSWHKFDRHRGESKAKPEDGEEDLDTSEPLMSEVADSRIFLKDEIVREAAWDEEELKAKIRAVLKPDYAEMIIAIHIDGMSCMEYAESIEQKPNTVNHRLQRAEKKFKEIFSKRPF